MPRWHRNYEAALPPTLKDIYFEYTIIIHIYQFLEAVDKNPVFFFSKTLLIIAAICCNSSIPCVIFFKKMYTLMDFSSVLDEIK